MYNKDEDLAENYIYEVGEGWIDVEMWDDEPYNYYTPMDDCTEYPVEYK